MNRYSEIVRRLMATRPIRLDRASVRRSVDNLVAHLKADIYWGRHPDEPLGDSFGFVDHVTIETVEGGSKEVEIQYRSKQSRAGDMVLGGGSGKTHKTQRPAIVILINGFYTPAGYTTTTSGERFYDEVLSVLMHELSHQADVFTKPSGPTSQRVLTDQEIDQKAYYNNPAEVRAYMREIYEEVFWYLPKLIGHFSVNESIRRLLKYSNTWKLVKSFLTDKNKDILLRGVYQAVQDYLAEQSMQKAAGEILRVAKDVLAGRAIDYLEKSLGRRVDIRSMGKAIAEKQKHGEYLVMFPDGKIEHAMDKAQAESKIRKWFNKNIGTGDIGTGLIEWR